ncbi:MAG: hypothetical protein ACREJO_17700 [Phycisphaerales bacterium]
MIGDEMNLPRDRSMLSAEGATRSEAIRTVVLNAAGLRRRRRMWVQTGGALAVVAVACGAVAMAFRDERPSRRPSTPDTVVVTLPGPKPAPQMAPVAPAPDGVTVAAHSAGAPSTSVAMVTGATGSNIEVIQPDPTILKRLAVEGPALTVRDIGDDELIALVERTGNRYGLERIGERVRMICLDCAGGFKGLGGGDSGGAGGGAPSTN